jgi:hypothetical protein
MLAYAANDKMNQISMTNDTRFNFFYQVTCDNANIIKVHRNDYLLGIHYI